MDGFGGWQVLRRGLCKGREGSGIGSGAGIRALDRVPKAVEALSR